MEYLLVQGRKPVSQVEGSTKYQLEQKTVSWAFEPAPYRAILYTVSFTRAG
jgi:hypothetical protein